MSLLNILLQSIAQQNQPPIPVGPSTAGVAPPQAGFPMSERPSSGPVNPPMSEKTVDSQGRPVDPNAVTEVAPIEVTPPPRVAPSTAIPNPPPPPLNYDNTADIQALRKAQANVPQPQGGGDNPGLWGMLPQGVQHGTLRNVLGAIGDAFLMHSGQQPMYEERLQRQKLAEAMAGYGNNPQAAIERVAGTAVPGAPEMADKMEQNYQNLQIRKQIAEQNNSYRQSVEQSRRDAIVARIAPTVAAWAQNPNIKTVKDYQAVYDRADAAAKRIDPSASALDMGYVPPEEWYPGAMTGIGATTGQIMHNDTSRASIAERATAAGMAHSDRQASLRQHPFQATTNTTLQSLIQKQNNGQQLTPAEQAYWNYHTQKKGSGGAGLHPTTTGGGAQPTAKDIAYLQQHPEKRALFENAFGKGSAAKYVK